LCDAADYTYPKPGLQADYLSPLDIYKSVIQ